MKYSTGKMIRRIWEKISRIQGESKPANAALALSGGGSRAAYQAGVIQYIAEFFPETQFQTISGVSAGAINAIHLANHTGTMAEAAGDMVKNWSNIKVQHIVESESTLDLFRKMLFSGSSKEAAAHAESGLHALADTSPMRTYLTERLGAKGGSFPGLAENLQNGRINACAIVTTNYMTGQTVTWIQGKDIADWQRPNRVGIQTTLNIEHVMASTSLPFLFPAVQIDKAWYGDGGIRLSAPLAPVIHLGADSILAISTRYRRTRKEADVPVTRGYPPASQIFGILANAIFLDALDQDARTLETINGLVDQISSRKRKGLRPIKFLLIRPSLDIGKLSGKYESALPAGLGLLSKFLGTKDTSSPDWLSMLMFEDEYVSQLLDIGYEDARRQHNEIATFFNSPLPASHAS